MLVTFQLPDQMIKWRMDLTMFLNYSLLYGCISLFVGIFIAWILELILHKGSEVEFELPQGTENSIQRDVHGDKKKSKGLRFSLM